LRAGGRLRRRQLYAAAARLRRSPLNDFGGSGHFAAAAVGGSEVRPSTQRDAALVESTLQAFERQATETADAQKSIAVLPFANISLDPEQECFFQS
jgi:hypothetical protein